MRKEVRPTDPIQFRYLVVADDPNASGIRKELEKESISIRMGPQPISPGETNRMSKHDNDNDYISITLSPVQVEQVMRAASKSPNGTVSNLLLAALDNAHDPPSGSHRRAYDLQRASQEALTAALDDPQLSQSLLRGLSVLACYGPDRPWRPIIELANQLGMSPSTTHRYVKTLKTIGLMEQDPTTREYRPVALDE
jgi:uncharacterized protein (DUF1778 family)